MSTRAHCAVVLAGLVLLLAACSRHEPVAAVAPRPVKVEVVQAAEAASQGSFIGTLRARRRADLSFEGPGRLAAVWVDVGDRVTAGQPLASLDTTPAQRRLEKAQADQAAAAAVLQERSTQLREHTALAQDRIVSPAALQAAQTQHEVAVAQLAAAEAALALARRDLGLSRITAPFDGEVVARLMQPHTDIAAGQPVLQIEAPQALEVVALLPDSVAAQLQPGHTMARLTAGVAPHVLSLPVRLERLSSRSDSGSLVQAIFRPADRSTGLRSGSTVSIEIAGGPAAVPSVPAQALLPGAQAGTGSVLVLDAAAGRLVRRQVQLGAGLLPNGRVPVTAGLHPGDRVVVAGTAFLSDGQPAVEHVAQTLLREDGP